MKSIIEPLSKHIPEGTADFVVSLVKNYNVVIHVVNSRKSKSADFRPSVNNSRPHRITINHDLSADAFLIILLHEIAHLITWERYKRTIKPHGPEWKNNYFEILTQLLKTPKLSENLKILIYKHLQNGIQSTIRETDFIRTMTKPKDDKPVVLVDDLPINTIFTLAGGKTFKKGVKLRSRYRCICINNNRPYLVGATARVSGIIEQ